MDDDDADYMQGSEDEVNNDRLRDLAGGLIMTAGLWI